MGSGETAARRRRRGILEENGGRKQRRGNQAVRGLGENSFNSSVGRQNTLLLKSIVVALFLQRRYYYTWHVGNGVAIIVVAHTVPAALLLRG